MDRKGRETWAYSASRVRPNESIEFKMTRTVEMFYYFLLLEVDGTNEVKTLNFHPCKLSKSN